MINTEEMIDNVYMVMVHNVKRTYYLTIYFIYNIIFFFYLGKINDR